jgi:hypothetical protein
LRALGEFMQHVRHVVAVIRIHPEIPLGGPDIIGRVWKSQFAVVGQRSPDVVRMPVGEHHLGDICFIDAGSPEVCGQPAIGRLVLIARADIDDDQIVAAANEGNVGFGFDQTCFEVSGARQDVLALFRCAFGRHDLDRHGNVTVAHHGDLEPALNEAVIVRHRSLLFWRALVDVKIGHRKFLSGLI